MKEPVTHGEENHENSG